MKILHCCLSSFYIDGYSYQENLLSKINKIHGHEVEIIASTEIYGKKGVMEYTEPKQYYNEDDIKVTRVPYANWLPRFLMKKIRAYKGVEKLLTEYAPDIIMFHGIATYELLKIVKYVKRYPNVKLYVDSHGDYNNSGRNIISKWVLHRLLYFFWIKKSINSIDKILYITEEVKEFLTKEYRIEEEKLEFYPLGGEIVLTNEKEIIRKEMRSEMGIDDSTIVVMHSGKLDELKGTDRVIDAIDKMQQGVILLIAGVIPESNEKLWTQIHNCNKVKWIGWQNPIMLRKYLCASDIYVQPGSQSATAQNAICCGVPVMLYPHMSYKKLLGDKAIWVRNSQDIYKELQIICSSREKLQKMSQEVLKIAENVLDYDKLARRIEN